MSFVDGFFTFAIALTNADRAQYLNLRLKAAKHPYESLEYLCARVLAYLHCYEEGLEFSQGLFEPKHPTIWRKDVLGAVDRWAEVGVPEKKKLQHALREHEAARHLIYFCDASQVDEFCHSCLRGSKSNWVSTIEFFQIEPAFLAAAAELIGTRVSLEATIVDTNVYLVINGVEFQTTIAPVDIWRSYQAAIGNA